MSNAVKLMEEISEVLLGFDSMRLQNLIDSLDIRRAAVAAVDRTRFSGMYASNLYESARIEAAGGKKWMEYLRNGKAWSINHITKTEKANSEARNAKIAAQLSKAGITKVAGSESNHSVNGFEGRWTVETDKGQKSVFINVILAGGYNIQCLHIRVLCKVV